ncbi:zinc finger (CCCH-type) family protein [Actinidia rufa]|uniref:Zinc finger (CCCH-type) family protein n=1 Tax=Actinidia rufa TaxID=165716 RepID=A0A7J0G382_9ERIC|nr:zinc finger (CCCH-type) family protein [Actinidia rufa]
MWIRNTSIPSISLQFGRFDTAHAIWDFLVTRYIIVDLAYTALATPSSRGRGSSSGSRGFLASGSQSSGSVSRPNESDCPNNHTRRDTHPQSQSTTATAGVSFSASASPTLIDLSSSSTPPYLMDPSIELFPEDVDVPAVLPDDTLHVAPPTIVYPVESSSTDLAPLVPPPVHLPSDLLVRCSTRFSPSSRHFSSPHTHVTTDLQPVNNLGFVPPTYSDSVANDYNLHNQLQFLSLENNLDTVNSVVSDFASFYNYPEPALGLRTSQRYFHGHLAPETFSQMLNPSSNELTNEDHIFLPRSLEKLELELTELLKSRRGFPILIASLPMLFYEKYGKSLQGEGYLTESQRHGKAGYSLTKFLARLKNGIFLI